MADRASGKGKIRPQKAPAKPGAARAKSQAPAPRGEDLDAECTRLREELATAKARIAELEQQREVLANRIDWVIDSLHTLLDE